ncbi:MAG: molybdopterin-dependent oxidoreductase [Proteobacteria bacterium]|nr:molybdopterin-dependent oxidoreductase [Pseudomonadota bacterium]
MAGEREIIKTTCPRDCYDGCGIAVVKRDGRIAKVLGDPDHPTARGALCGKCAVAYNGVWLDPEVRLLHPMKRTGPKGSSQFTAISWNEALSTIAERFHAIGRESGFDRILHTHYTGTCSSLAIGFPGRFFARLGATEAEPDTICNNAGHVAWGYVFGDSHIGFDPRTARDSACILVWGANPSHSAPHAHKHWLKESPAKVIVVDPVRHETAAAADLHLQLRPGSDAALAFGLVHVMVREGLIDQAYIDAHVLGWDELQADIAMATPAWTAAQTGLPAAQIEEPARIYGAGPSLLWLGQGLQRQPSGGNIFRACAMLPAASGNIGKPGAGFYYLNDAMGIVARKGAAPAWQPPARAAPEDMPDGPPSVSQMDVPDQLNDASRIRSYVVWNCNPLASNPAQTKMRSGLAREDLFTVVIDCFPTDTAAYADIVLPAASFLEFDDISTSYFHFTIGAQAKAAEPMGQSLPNQEIFRRLATAMGFEDKHLHARDEEMLEKIMARSGTGLSFAQLKEKGWAWGTPEPLVLWLEGSFPTPSGKIELASERAAADGHPRLPRPQADAPPADGRLRLLSPAGKWLMNSLYGNDPRIVELMGQATVAIHPDDARRHNIGDGAAVTLSNAAGCLTLKAVISDIIPAGALLTDKSRWPGKEGGSNVNVLHVPQKTDMGESTSVHGVEVTLSAA